MEAFNISGLHHPYRKCGKTMQMIVKVIGVLIGLFVMANGIWTVMMPPYGDEPTGYAIIAVGIFLPVITFYVAGIDDRSEA